MTRIYDYIIVGAGTAGCVLANRLSVEPARRVMLLEAGPEDSNMWITIPAGVPRVINDPKLTWGYTSDPEPGLNDRQIIWPRGRVLGGSSSINGHVYMRGVPEDYDAWALAGNPGWAWSEVLPYFKKGERHYLGASPLHGGNGELAVSPLAHPHPASAAFVASANAAGMPLNQDFNGVQQEGVGYLQFMTDRGRRASASAAFLRPIRHRANLTVETGAMVDRIIVEQQRATGIAYRREGNRMAASGRHIILCGGAINTPQLLMLSGIGPASELLKHGIVPIVDTRDVGRHLQDHVYAHHLESVIPAFSINRTISSNWRMAPHVLRYFATRKGLLTSAAAQVGLFARSHPELKRPNLQIQMRPFSMVSSGGMYTAQPSPAVTASCTLLRPRSRGAVTLRSANPNDAPAMRANYLVDEHDVPPMIAGLRLMRRIFATEPFASASRGEVMPGRRYRTDDELVDYLRNNAQAMYHPVGTCRMGPDADAVVDSRLRVTGLEGLRIVDASIMPTIPSGNTNAPTIMIAEKGADMIIEDERALTRMAS
jgi:choline dehydrogenase